MLPSPPFPRLSLDEQYQKTKICNPRSRNLAQIGLIICLLLSNFLNNDESSYGEDAILGESPQIPVFAQYADEGGEQLSRAAIARVDNNGHPSPGDDKPLLWRRKRRKRQRGLIHMEPRSKWRLGFVCIRYRGFLFKLSMVGATVKQKSVHTSWNESYFEENWEKICSSLWNGRKGQRILRSPRLFLSYLSLYNVTLPNLVSMCWLNDFKLTIWTLYYDELSSKDQSENLNPAGRTKPLTTMVNKTLKGSAPHKPKEARPSGYKTGKRKNKAEFDMAALLVRLLWVKEIVLQQSDNMHPIDETEPTPTMVDKTLKGSTNTKPFEAGPLGTTVCLNIWLSRTATRVLNFGENMSQFDHPWSVRLLICMNLPQSKETYLAVFSSKLSGGVKENISQLKETPLYAFVLDDPTPTDFVNSDCVYVWVSKYCSINYFVNQPLISKDCGEGFEMMKPDGYFMTWCKLVMLSWLSILICVIIMFNSTINVYYVGMYPLFLLFMTNRDLNTHNNISLGRCKQRFVMPVSIYSPAGYGIG